MPAAGLIVPPPLGLTAVVRTYVGTAVKLAVTVLSASMVTEQAPEPVHAPLQLDEGIPRVGCGRDGNDGAFAVSMGACRRVDRPAPARADGRRQNMRRPADIGSNRVRVIDRPASADQSGNIIHRRLRWGDRNPQVTRVGQHLDRIVSRHDHPQYICR